MGEGISSALATGYLAGRSVVESAGSPPGALYRRLAAPERERTVKEWRLTSLLTGEARPEFRASLQGLPLPQRLRVLSGILAWQWKGKMVPALSVQGLELALRRCLHGDYDFRS